MPRAVFGDDGVVQRGWWTSVGMFFAYATYLPMSGRVA